MTNITSLSCLKAFYFEHNYESELLVAFLVKRRDDDK